jgi:hypothetical protein
MSKDEYSIFEHEGDQVREVWTFTYNELKTVWRMLNI